MRKKIFSLFILTVILLPGFHLPGLTIEPVLRSAQKSSAQAEEIAIRNLTDKVVAYTIKPAQASTAPEKMRLEVGSLARFTEGTPLVISFQSQGNTITYRLDPGKAYTFRYSENETLELYEGSHSRTDAPDLAPFVATPLAVVEKMLEMARVTQKDVIYDLGCGDGRIVITAAKRYGARGVGIDLDPERIKESTANAIEAGVSSLVQFRQQDAMKADISQATVVTLYLLPESNAILRPLLEKQLKAGARVVSHNYHMPGWEKKEIAYDELTTGDGELHTIYVYKK
jgi:tRNA/tmRNA/rRNA uracil-C5-methylase (TrmA/RlmC/RlmD family)